VTADVFTRFPELFSFDEQTKVRYSPFDRIAGRGAGAWSIHMEAARQRDQDRDVIFLTLGHLDQAPHPVGNTAAPTFAAVDRVGIALSSAPRRHKPFQTDPGALG
jgi:hypothetical protein